MNRFLCISLVFGLLIGCAHSVDKGLNKVEVGDTRADVIDKVGSPVYVTSRSSELLWVYRYFDHDNKQWVKKAVVFREGVVVNTKAAPQRDVVLGSNFRGQHENDLEKMKSIENGNMGTKVKGTIREKDFPSKEEWYREILKMQEKEAQENNKNIELEDFNQIK
ncbi:MAG: hypothetical protein AB8E15_05500 [Bdellovibrionales bacterium]